MEEENIDYDELCSGKIEDTLIEVVDKYYKTYGKSEYDTTYVLQDLASKDDKIKALTEAIINIGDNEGLDLNAYKTLMSDNVNIDNRVMALIEKGNTKELLSILGGEALSLSDLYKEHQNLKLENPEYSSNIVDYNNIRDKWRELCSEYGEPPVSIAEDWNKERENIYKNLEGTPIDKMMNNNIYGNVRNTIKGLEDSKKMEQSRETQSQTTENSKKTEQNTQLQTNNGNSFWQGIKEKISKTIENLKGLFGGNQKFEQEVMEPAQNELNQMTEENKSLETNVWDRVSNFINENVVEKAKNLKDKIPGKFEDFKETIFGSQDLGELSQNFLDAKENGDTDQMARLSKQLIRIYNKEELERYKDMSTEQVYNAKFAEGLSILDTDNYKETLDENELNKYGDILEGYRIATREKYRNNDFDTNRNLISDKLQSNSNSDKSRTKDELAYEKAKVASAIVCGIKEVDRKIFYAEHQEDSTPGFLKSFGDPIVAREKGMKSIYGQYIAHDPEMITGFPAGFSPYKTKAADDCLNVVIDYMEKVEKKDLGSAKRFFSRVHTPSIYSLVCNVIRNPDVLIEMPDLDTHESCDYIEEKLLKSEKSQVQGDSAR